MHGNFVVLICCSLVLTCLFEDVKAQRQRFNEKERFFRTRFLPSMHLYRNKTIDNEFHTKRTLFNWDLNGDESISSNKNDNRADRVIALIANEPSSRANDKLSEPDIKKTSAATKRNKSRVSNGDERGGSSESRDFRKKIKRKRTRTTKTNINGGDNRFIWTPASNAGDTKTKLNRNKRRKLINRSHGTPLVNNGRALITPAANRLNDNDEGRVGNLPGQITKLTRSLSNNSNGDENRRRSTNTFESRPKTDREQQSNALFPLIARRNTQRLRKSDCGPNGGGCEHFCHRRGTKLRCSCLRGFRLAGDGKSCSDYDECATDNGGCQYACRNTPGSFECGCPRGLRLNGDARTCDDVNECLLRNGHGPCQDTCENTHGSYVCSCANLRGTKLANDRHGCVADASGCARNNSGCSHKCVDTVARTFCSCPAGMELDFDWKTCKDIDECEDDEVKANCRGRCVNTIGSYECASDYDAMQSDQQSSDECRALDWPKHGYLRCGRTDDYAAVRMENDVILAERQRGTFCTLVCRVGYKIVGTFNVTCNANGFWEGEIDGRCEMLMGRNYDPRFNYIHVKWAMPPPKIECPESKVIHLDREEDRASIRFHPPKTNVEWKNVKGYPQWIKELRAILLPGYHSFSFVATDPDRVLSDSCSFHIIVKKPFINSS